MGDSNTPRDKYKKQYPSSECQLFSSIPHYSTFHPKMNPEENNERLPQVGDSMDYGGYSFICFTRTEVVSKFHCELKDFCGCPALLWVWASSQTSPLGLHANHPEEDDLNSGVRRLPVINGHARNGLGSSQRIPARQSSRPVVNSWMNKNPKRPRSASTRIQSPRTLIEMAVMLNNYPQSRTKFIKNLANVWCQHKLPHRNNNEILMLSWALPLVPENFRRKAFQIITETSFEIENEHLEVAIFVRHVEQLDNFLQLGGQIRVSNITENFTAQLIRQCGVKPSSVVKLLRK
ncbi:hypothetical protein KQX54_009524 [Cotesia glomerata]|uniref:Uncharacterized protein n=1 Tax=Cotesia glomerata TaxID=32391 RepID=A0AAV7IKH6_COTGL|nr:hypothetical protein KQX54_009524 [Cotesia glomerata]